MNRTYKTLLFDENEIKGRNAVADWLQSNRYININKYDNNWGQNISIQDAFYILRNSVENKLPEQQRADTWETFIDKIRDIKIGRPVTKLEDIAINHMNNNNVYSSTMFEILGNTEKRICETSSTLTQFVYIGAKDETNCEMGVVKTVYGKTRDQEFENRWYISNDKAKLYCIKNEFSIPVSSVSVWTKDNKDILPESKSFSRFVSGHESNKPIEKIEKYIEIAINQVDDYLQLDQDDRKTTITQKYLDYMKLYLNTDNDDQAMKEMLSLGKKRKSIKRSRTDYEEDDNDINESNKMLPENLDYSMDKEMLEINRDLWNKKKLFGYKRLYETNNMYAPYGYNEDLTERIAPYGFLKDDPDNRARLKNNGKGR